MLVHPVGEDATGHPVLLVTVSEPTEEPPRHPVPVDLEVGWRKERLGIPALRLDHSEPEYQRTVAVHHVPAPNFSDQNFRSRFVINFHASSLNCSNGLGSAFTPLLPPASEAKAK